MSQPLRRGVGTLSCTRVLPPRARPGASSLHRAWQTRCLQIRATPAEQPASGNGDHLPFAGSPSSAESTDARFDVIGAPYSLFFDIEYFGALSTSSRWNTFSVPEITSFAVVHLNGSVDWMVAQRQALLAWTGRSLSVRPTVNRSLSLAHWGSSEVTGRGLLALVGTGQLYSIELKAGEQYIVHPSNVVAYTISSNPPRPYRFKSTTLKFQVPGLKSLPKFVQDSKFIRDMSDSNTWKTTMRILHKIRTWSRMTIWGDRLFLQFDGPTTIILQTRGPRINEVLTSQEVNEIADSPRGLTTGPARPTEKQQPFADEEFRQTAEEALHAAPAPSRTIEELEMELKGTSQSIAKLTKDGQVVFEKAGQKN
ncbi:hypothetical protein EYZ11_001696 [Aspergillus tanneri]|uniref:Altered inheritance of mitochondria protein 24, mitochondrial n=1 Tax=Aspergillus tanneri TaxID=1220188 RepID=A0A4S3JSN2_9EURO|nr:hypothetical protein EYZ11_001696 [Aspergillus tanneri]